MHVSETYIANDKVLLDLRPVLLGNGFLHIVVVQPLDGIRVRHAPVCRGKTNQME